MMWFARSPRTDEEMERDVALDMAEEREYERAFGSRIESGWTRREKAIAAAALSVPVAIGLILLLSQN